MRLRERMASEQHAPTPPGAPMMRWQGGQLSNVIFASVGRCVCADRG